MPTFNINCHQKEDGSLPIDQWAEYEAQDVENAIVIAIDQAGLTCEDLPLTVHVQHTDRTWPNGTPMATQSYRIEKTN
jgi:hypothetical protein